MGKLVVGVGVNDADYPVVRFEMVSGKRKRVWICHYYQTWMNMLNRVYSTYPSNDAYRGNITVCDEWLTLFNIQILDGISRLERQRVRQRFKRL